MRLKLSVSGRVTVHIQSMSLMRGTGDRGPKCHAVPDRGMVQDKDGMTCIPVVTVTPDQGIIVITPSVGASQTCRPEGTPGRGQVYFNRLSRAAKSLSRKALSWMKPAASF